MDMHNNKYVNKARQNWMEAFMQSMPNLKYIKQLSLKEVAQIVDDKEGMDFVNKKRTKPFIREFHLFEQPDETPVIAQWRWVPTLGSDHPMTVERYTVERKAEGSDEITTFKMQVPKD
jgi:hypothetical protein